MARHGYIRFSDPIKWDDFNDRRMFEMFREHNTDLNPLALCFTKAPETFHHWKIFAGHQSGIRIEFDEAKLKILSKEQRLKYKKMKYAKLDDLNKYTSLKIIDKMFLKRYAYRDEKEYRILKFSNRPEDDKLLGITRDMIKSIYVGPYASKETTEILEQEFQIPIKMTSVANNKIWEQFSSNKAIPCNVRKY